MLQQREGLAAVELGAPRPIVAISFRSPPGEELEAAGRPGLGKQLPQILGEFRGVGGDLGLLRGTELAAGDQLLDHLQGAVDAVLRVGHHAAQAGRFT